MPTSRTAAYLQFLRTIPIASQYTNHNYNHFRGFPRRGSSLRAGRGRGFSQPPIIYYQCRKTGHIARDCFSSQTQVNRGPPNQSAYANVVENLEVTLAELQEMNHSSPWYMDSGASTHVT